MERCQERVGSLRSLRACLIWSLVLLRGMRADKARRDWLDGGISFLTGREFASLLAARAGSKKISHGFDTDGICSPGLAGWPHGHIQSLHLWIEALLRLCMTRAFCRIL